MRARVRAYYSQSLVHYQSLFYIQYLLVSDLPEAVEPYPAEPYAAEPYAVTGPQTLCR